MTTQGFGWGHMCTNGSNIVINEATYIGIHILGTSGETLRKRRCPHWHFTLNFTSLSKSVLHTVMPSAYRATIPRFSCDGNYI
jgi:hypothetical protein